MSDEQGGPDPLDAEGSDDADSQTVGLYYNLVIGIPVTLLCLLLFDPIRRRIPSVFETRRKLHEQRDPLDYLGNRVTTPPAPSYKLLGWFMPTLRLNLETISHTHGLDAALFLRYQRAMIALFSAFLLPTLCLIPTYFSASGEAIGINKFTTSNIAEGDPWRFWFVLVVEYLIVIFVCYFIFQHLTIYCRDRRRYRAARHPANYAVLVQDIPSYAQTADSVREYWELVFPGQIAAVYYVQDARRLEKYKEEFWKAVSERETAEWRAHDLQQHTIQKQQKKEDHVRRRAAHRNRDQPMVSGAIQDEPDVEHGAVRDPVFSASHITEPESVYNPDPDDTRQVDSMSDESEVNKKNSGGVRRRLRSLAPKRGPPKDPNAAIEFWEKTQRKAWSRVMAYQSRRDEGEFATTSSAIVVFKSRRSASIAAQTNFSRMENVWRVSRAPEPNAINWGALCVGGWSIYLRQAITAILSVALILFWVAPVTAIMSLVSISELVTLKINGSQPFAFLSFLEDLNPLMSGLIESWAPAIVLSFFLSLVPVLFRLFVSVSRIVSNAERDRNVRDWYFMFVTFSNFLFVVFAGTILNEISAILNDPPSAVNILATNIPKQAAFMMNFILLTALTEVPRELLQFGRVVTRAVKLKYFAKTERQRKDAEVGEMDMDFVEGYSISQLMTLLGIVYCTIQPLITVCCLVYFTLAHVVTKYNLLYSFHNEYEDGGRMYGGAIYAVWVGLFVHLLTMVGVFGLNKSLPQLVLIIIPTVISVLFVLHCRRSFEVVIEQGSALETQDRVQKMEGVREDIIEDSLAETYEHPGWEELPPYQEIENMNGVVAEAHVRKEKERKLIEEDMLVEELTASETTGTGNERDGRPMLDSRPLSSAPSSLPENIQHAHFSADTTASSGGLPRHPGSAFSGQAGPGVEDDDDDVDDEYLSVAGADDEITWYTPRI